MCSKMDNGKEIGISVRNGIINLRKENESYEIESLYYAYVGYISNPKAKPTITKKYFSESRSL